MTTHMPPRTRRWHAPKGKGEWWGDRLQALNVAARQDYRYIDQNVQWAWRNPADHALGGTAFVMHWGFPGRDNYRFILDPHTRRVRRMTRTELRRPIFDWPAAQVHLWRRHRWRSSARPMSLAVHARRATAVGIQIIPELKARAFMQHLPAAQVGATMRRHGQQPWFMALWSMWGIEQKTAAVIDSGGQFAVIFGGRTERMPAAEAQIRQWKVQPTRVWA